MLRTPHTATYTKISITTVDRKRTKQEGTPTQDRFLIEPLPAKWRAAITARIPSARKVISWRHPLELKDGDKVEFQGRTYYLNEVVDDVYRGRWPYYTAIGAEKFHG